MNLAQVEKLIKADIRWAITKGPGWNPGFGATYASGHWTTCMTDVSGRYKACGVCAIGAVCIRRQPQAIQAYGMSDDVITASKFLGRDEDWVSDLYLTVNDIGKENSKAKRKAVIERLLSSSSYKKSAVQMAASLVEYAESYRRKIRAVRKTSKN